MAAAISSSIRRYGPASSAGNSREARSSAAASSEISGSARSALSNGRTWILSPNVDPDTLRGDSHREYRGPGALDRLRHFLTRPAFDQEKNAPTPARAAH